MSWRRYTKEPQKLHKLFFVHKWWWRRASFPTAHTRWALWLIACPSPQSAVLLYVLGCQPRLLALICDNSPPPPHPCPSHDGQALRMGERRKEQQHVIGGWKNGSVLFSFCLRKKVRVLTKQTEKHNHVLVKEAEENEPIENKVL